MVRFLVSEGTAMRHESRRAGMLSDGSTLLHDNARSNTANLVRDKLQRFDWKTLKHPPYSPDLSPCDFYIFGDLKEDIRGRRVGFIRTRMYKNG